MCGFHGKYVNQKGNKWSLGNSARYQDPEYDKLWDQAWVEIGETKRAELFKQMNDIVVQDVVHIPLVGRKSVYGRAKNLQNVNYTPWDNDYWNIANWVKA